ncbi:MAG TPA: TRAP transporter substrate-binding protein [Burkholderiales bacterium]
MKNIAKTFWKSIAAAVLLLGITGPAAAQAPITLKISHYLPPTHGFQTDFLGPWAKELEERTGGRVKAEIYAVNTAYGDAARQADQVRAGVIDIALGLRGIPRGRFPASSIIELPFMVADARDGSRVLWQLYKEGALGNEYDDFKVLALFTHHGGLFHTKDRPIRRLEDLRGLRMRTPSPAISAMLEYLGASPVGMPPAQIYEGLQRGVLDGLVTTWDLVGAIKLNEQVKYHTDADAYTAAFYVVMNKRKYESLPEDVRRVIDDMSGDNLIPKFGPWWDKWEARGFEDAKRRGQDVIAIDAATRAQWKKQLQPMIDKYLESLKAEGVKDPHALYRRALELLGQ